MLIAPLPLKAAMTAEVTITATGYVVGAPGDFTITYISDWEISLSWTKGIGANNTMIRARYGEVPSDREDGYLVYYSDGTYCTDLVVNLDDPPEEFLTGDVDSLDIYYRAWSQHADGSWEAEGISDFIGGVGLTFIGMIVLGAFLMIAGFWRKSQALLWVAALVWVGFAFWQRGITPEWGTWDLHEIMFYVGFLIVIICSVEAVMLYRDEQPVKVKRAPESTPAERHRKMMEDLNIRVGGYGIQRRKR